MEAPATREERLLLSHDRVKGPRIGFAIRKESPQLTRIAPNEKGSAGKTKGISRHPRPRAPSREPRLRFHPRSSSEELDRSSANAPHRKNPDRSAGLRTSPPPVAGSPPFFLLRAEMESL